jgi:RNA polymerase-binding transcription factor DksA
VEAAALDPPDDEHDPEGATVGFERAMTLDLLRQAEADLAGLDSALARVAGGAYGVCAACGGPIGAERLAAHPAASMCVDCAQSSAAAISSRVRPTLKAGDPGSIRRPSASEPTS